MSEMEHAIRRHVIVRIPRWGAISDKLAASIDVLARGGKPRPKRKRKAAKR